MGQKGKLMERSAMLQWPYNMAFPGTSRNEVKGTVKGDELAIGYYGVGSPL